MKKADYLFQIFRYFLIVIRKFIVNFHFFFFVELDVLLHYTKVAIVNVIIMTKCPCSSSGRSI